MFQHQGIWLPDGEKHFPEWMDRNGELVDGRGTYQIKKLRAALSCVRSWRRAVDVGAHAGLWSMQLSGKFDKLDAFEPVPLFRECFLVNMRPTRTSLALHSSALGARPGSARIAYDPKDSGGTHIDESGSIEVNVDTMDEYEFHDVDFIKIDCEGYEHEVILGAASTIARCRPVIIVEQKPHKLGSNFGIVGRPAVDLLLRFGYTIVREMSGDFIMTHGG